MDHREVKYMDFAGEVERLGLKDEDDVVAMMKEFRKQRWEELRHTYCVDPENHPMNIPENP